jgi:hypothetical protein
MALNNAALRAEFAKKIVADSADEYDGDVLTPFDRDIVGASSVQLRIPLKDPVALRTHLALIEETARALRLRLEQSAKDRSHLFTARGVIRQLNKRINAYRVGDRD